MLEVDEWILFSVLCSRAKGLMSKHAKSFKRVGYQKRGVGYEVMPVYLLKADHEYMHCKRLAGKVSVSRMFALAIDLFLEEILEKGINDTEVVLIRKKNSYQKQTYSIRNLTIEICKNNKFEEFIMKMRMKKT